jgi:nucleoside-diphosphate-sugar epimerase
LSAAPAPGAIKPTVVLVHGAWADTSSWDGEYDALSKQGYDVRAIANPLESLDRLHTHLQRLRQIAKRRPPRMQQTVSEHLAICAAIHDGDETAAAQATALHIINSLHNILAVMTDDVIGRTTFATPTTADGHEQETRCDTR